MFCDEHGTVDYCPACLAEEQASTGIPKERAKKIATEFFYWWHNQPGSNTQDGFDDWWDKHGKSL